MSNREQAGLTEIRLTTDECRCGRWLHSEIERDLRTCNRCLDAEYEREQERREFAHYHPSANGDEGK